MRPTSLVVASAVVLLANAFALGHAWRNRSGPVETDITLTERELPHAYRVNDEDSGVSLNLLWTDPQWPLYFPGPRLPWLDQKRLQEIGFDTSVPPSDKRASEFYGRQRSRRAFVALEYDGAGWRKWMDEMERRAQEQTSQPVYPRPADQRESSSRLVVIDAASDAARLRVGHADRSTVIILPAVIRLGLDPERPNKPAELYGSIQEMPSTINVPRPFSDLFRNLPAGRSKAKYHVHVRYGALLEPWIAGVEFPTPAVR